MIPYSDSPIYDQIESVKINTIDLHTGGEPLRVVTGGFPEIKGNTILDKRRYVQEHYDDLRKALMWEPRGHSDMYGCLVTESNHPEAAFAVLFMHNEGYSTMCGHAVIALGKLAVERGWVQESSFTIDAPCGLIPVQTELRNGLVVSTTFDCVPSFVDSLNNVIDVKGHGPVRYDLAYGGAYYAYLDAGQFGLDVTPENITKFIDLGRRIKSTIIAQGKEPVHPREPDLGFLYGTIFIGPAKDQRNHSRNICVFADGEVDRSPTGSGVAGRLAIHYKKKEVQIGQTITIESVLGSAFACSVKEEVDFAQFKSIIPTVTGSAYLTGEHTFVIDPNDPFRGGFLLK